MNGGDDIMSDGVSSFLRAARAGNLDKILDFLNNGLDINASNNNGLNALHLASKEGHMKIIIELLSRGAHVDAITKKGNTALHIASLAGQEEVVKLLIDRGAKVNVQSQNGFTPLYMASQENHAEVVRYLLINNANQGLATEDGFTPLAVALQQGHDKVVALLLENDAKGRVKLPALHIAAKKDDVKATSLLLQSEHHLDTTSKRGGLVNDTTKSGFTPLHISAHYGNMNVGRLLVERGADVNYKARNSITPLHVASKWGRVAMIQLLLDHNADIEAKTRDGLTPLHCAARSGHDQTVDILLERGASVTAKTKNSLTPLHMAAQGDHVDCVRLLLYRKAVIDDITIDYLTPLHVVAHCGNFRTAQLLLDRKCEVNARALNGFTPLHIACKKNRIKIVELLLKYGATIEATTESGLTPLHVASFMGHLNIAIFLLQKGANPNQTTVRGETSLHLAARANQTDILRALLRNGAQIDHAKAREQQTPLHIVARLGNVENLLLLLQHGASPDALTKDSYTPLHIAAKEGHDEICHILLDHGAKQTVKSKRGFTPLHVAAKNGQLRVVKRLVEHGANVDIEGKNGLTPLHVATHYDVVDVALYLLEKNANPHCTSKNGYTSLHIAAKKNEMEIALTLLQHGADPNAKSKNGFTPLHLATQEGNVDLVALLLEHSAGSNVQAKNGLVPLHLAAQEDSVPSAEVLKHFGVNMNQQTNAGYTPLHTACHFGQLNMVKFLLDNGASVNHTTQMGYTPLHQAAQQGHVMVINQLLKAGASPDKLTESGQSALSIAQRLGYISVVEILKKVTEVNVEPCQSHEKYKSIFPETMQEVPMSDSENEGGEELIGTDPAFLYLANNDITLEEGRYKGECDAFGFERSSEKYSCTSSPGAYIDDMKYIGGHQKVMLTSREDFDTEDDEEVKRMMTLKRKKMMNGVQDDNMISSFSDASQSSVQPGEFNPDQLISMVRSAALLPQPPYITPMNRHVQSYHEAVEKSAIPHGILNWKSFLVSFMVDARGGAMRGCRHSGVRFIIPPNNICMPTRITCRLVKRDKLMCPPPLMEGESLASRVIEMGPVGVKFAGLIIIEVPHFASLSGKEREILILRSENGETWKEHNFLTNCKISKEAMTACLNELEATEDLSGNHHQHQQQHHNHHQRKICRILSSDLPQYFALVTRIKQETSTIGPEGGIISSTVVPQVQAVFPEGSLTKSTKVGLQVQPVSSELVSKYGGNRVAVSSVVTIEPRRRKFHRPITLTLPSPKAAQKGMVNNYGPGSEAPSVRLLCSIVGGTNAALWEDITDSTPLVFTNNCVSFTTSISARFWLMDCQNTQETVKMASDIYPEVTLVPFFCRFAVFARRSDAIEGRLRAFCLTDDKCDKILESHDRFELIARSRDIEVLEGRPLYVEMAGNLVPVSKNNEQICLKAFTPFIENRLPFVVRLRDHHQDPTGLLAFMSSPRDSRSRNDKPPTPVVTLNINLPQYVPMEDAMKQDDIVFREKYEPMKKRRDERLSKTEQWILEVSKEMMEDDYAKLGLHLGLDVEDVEKISKQFADVNEKALVVMQAWTSRSPESATGAHLEEALKEIGRSDLADLCPCDVINVTHAVGQAASKVFLDSTGFEALRVELGASSKGSSITRGMSLDVSYEEQDLIKDSGSTMDEFSDIGSTADKFGSQEEVDDMRDDITPTKDDFSTPTKESPSPDGFEDEEMDTIKRKPKLPEDEIKSTKKAIQPVGAIPIEIPIVTKVITESRLSEIESSYDKSQERVINKLNPEPEFELIEQKKPPGYVKDQVRKWENVLTDPDDLSSDSQEMMSDDQDITDEKEDDIQSMGEDQEVEDMVREQPMERITHERRLEDINFDQLSQTHAHKQEIKAEIHEEVKMKEKDNFPQPVQEQVVAEIHDHVTSRRNIVKTEESKPSHIVDAVASTSGVSSPSIIESVFVERSVASSAKWDNNIISEEQEDDEHVDDVGITLSDYSYTPGDRIIDLSFEEADLIKQSESTDEDEESSLVSSVIEIESKPSTKELNQDIQFQDTSVDPPIDFQENPDVIETTATTIDAITDNIIDIKDQQCPSTQQADTPPDKDESEEISPVDNRDIYKYRPETDCYEYKKYRQGNEISTKVAFDKDDVIEESIVIGQSVDQSERKSESIQKGLEKLCQGDDEVVSLIQEAIIDSTESKLQQPDIIREVYVQSTITDSPSSTTIVEKKQSISDDVEMEHKVMTTTKSTTITHTFLVNDISSDSITATTTSETQQDASSDKPLEVVTSETLPEFKEQEVIDIGSEVDTDEGIVKRITEVKTTEFVIERKIREVEMDETNAPTEHQNEESNVDDDQYDYGPLITVTEDDSSPIDDDDFIGYYGIQSYIREQHDDSDLDVDFVEEEIKKHEEEEEEEEEDKKRDIQASADDIEPHSEKEADDDDDVRSIIELKESITSSSPNQEIEHFETISNTDKPTNESEVEVEHVYSAEVIVEREVDSTTSIDQVNDNELSEVPSTSENIDFKIASQQSENEIIIQHVEEVSSNVEKFEFQQNDDIPVIESFDETLTRKLNEHKVAVEKRVLEGEVGKRISRSYGLLSFPEICIQAASPMAQSPEDEDVEASENQEMDDESSRDKNDIATETINEDRFNEDSELIGDEMLGQNISAEIILGSEVLIDDQKDIEQEDMIDFSDNDNMKEVTMSDIRDQKFVSDQTLLDEDIKIEHDLCSLMQDKKSDHPLVEIDVGDFSVSSHSDKPDVFLDLCVSESELNEQTESILDESYYDNIASEKVKEIMEACKSYSSEEIPAENDNIKFEEDVCLQEKLEADQTQDDVEVDSLCDESDYESNVLADERTLETTLKDLTDIQQSDDDLTPEDKLIDSKARLIANDILEHLKEEMLQKSDEITEPVAESIDRPTGFKIVGRNVSSENIKLECLGGALNSGPKYILDSPLSDLAAQDDNFDHLGPLDQKFGVPIDTSPLMGTSTSSAASDIQDGELVSKEIKSVEEKDIDEKEHPDHPRGRHVIIVDDDDDYADDESDSTKPEKGIGENEKEFAEDEEFEIMDTRDGDELCWVGPQDMELSDEDEISKSLVNINIVKEEFKNGRKTKAMVKRVSSDSILNDPTPESHPPVSHFQLGLNFQQDIPRAPFHTPVKISPSDSCYDFGQMQFSIDPEMSERHAQRKNEKRGKVAPFELKPEDLERKLSRCSGGSASSSLSSSSSGRDLENSEPKDNQIGESRIEGQIEGTSAQEIEDGMLSSQSLAERMFSAIETSLISSQEILSSPDNQYKTVSQDLTEAHLEKVSLERLSASSPVEINQQSILDSSALPENFKSPPMSPFSDLTLSGNNIFSEILSSDNNDDSSGSSKGRLGNVRVGQSPSEFITEVEEIDEESEVDKLDDHQFEAISSEIVKTGIKDDDENEWSEDNDYCYVCIENVKNYLILQRNSEGMKTIETLDDPSKGDVGSESNEDQREDKPNDEKDFNHEDNVADDGRANHESENLNEGKESSADILEPSDQVDEMYKDAVLDNITRFCMSSLDVNDETFSGFFSESYTVNKLRCKQLSDEFTDDVLTPDAFSSNNTSQHKNSQGRFDFKTDNMASCADIIDDSDLCVQQAIQESFKSCQIEYRSDYSDQEQDCEDFCPRDANLQPFSQTEITIKSEKPSSLMLADVLSSTQVIDSISPKSETKQHHCSSSSSTRNDDYSSNSNNLTATQTDVRSMSSEDVPEASTSSDTSAEPTILAATYDLQLGAVSRVVAAYDISPDTVERKMANIQVENTLKRIMSSPEDDVFEQQQEVSPLPHESSSQEGRSDADCHDEESREDEEDITVRSVTPPDLSAMPEENVVDSSDFMLSPSWDLCPELDPKSSIDSVGDADFAQQADDEQSFDDESSPFESFQAREMVVSDDYAYDGSDNIYDEEEYGGDGDVVDDTDDPDYQEHHQPTNICSEKYSLSDDFSSTISPITKHVFEDWQPDASEVFTETQMDDEDIDETQSDKNTSEDSVMSDSNSDVEAAGIDFVLTKAEGDHPGDNENDSLEYYCWKPRQRGDDCDDSSILSSNTEASYGSYCLNSQRNNGNEVVERPISPVPMEIRKLGKPYESCSAEEGHDEDYVEEEDRVTSPPSDTSECTEKKLSEVVMDMMDEMVNFEPFNPFTAKFDEDDLETDKSIDFVSQQWRGKERHVEQLDFNFSAEADDDDGLERSDSFEEVTEEILMERKAEEFVAAVIREAHIESEGSENNIDYVPTDSPSSPLGSTGISVCVTKEWKSVDNKDDEDDESRHEDSYYDDEDNDDNDDGHVENDYLSSQALDYSEAVTKSLSSEDDIDQMEEDDEESGADYDEIDEPENYYTVGRSCDHKVMTIKRQTVGFSSKFSPNALARNLHHQFRDPGLKCLDDSYSPDDQGDSSSLDSFATVVGTTVQYDERINDLSSMASSIHSDVIPMDFATQGESLQIEMDSPENNEIDLTCPVLSATFTATENLHAKKDIQEELGIPVTTIIQPENIDATSSEESILDQTEDDEGQSSSARSDEELLSDTERQSYGDRMLVVEYCDTMLATIREEEERLSSLSGKTSSSSSARLAESKQQQILQLQQHQLQQKKQQQQQKNFEKDTASVSSSLLEFERLEKELQEKTSNPDSNGSLRTHGPKGSSNDTEDKASSSQSGDAAADDNLSISSSLAEFEQLEDELKQSPTSEKVSTNVPQIANLQSVKKEISQSTGLMGSNTSLQSFSLVTGSPMYEGDPSLIQPTDVESSLLEDFYDLASKISDHSAGSFVNDLVVLDQDGTSKSEDSSIHSSSKYPEYQDIVQIIRDAAESSGDIVINRSAYSDDLRKSQTVITTLENSAESGAWTQSESSFVAICTNSQASLSNLISLEDSMVSSALDDSSQVQSDQAQMNEVATQPEISSEHEPEKFAERLCEAVLKSVTKREEGQIGRSKVVTSDVEDDEDKEDEEI